MAHTTNGTRLIAPHRFSNVVGAIYDCAIDPERWPEALHAICDDLRCMLGGISLFDLQRSQIRCLKIWNMDARQVEQILQNKEYREDLMFHYRQWPIDTQPIDEPMAFSRVVDVKTSKKTKFAQDFSDPRGDCDSISTMVVRNFPQFGMFSATRHKSEGLITDDDLALLRLFAPHIRRAITISDLMELKMLEAQALSATLDRLTMGVVVLAGENRILHANEAARHMLANGGRIVSRRGRLAARDAAADAELAKAIDLSRRDEAALGATGIGISLGSADTQPALAHVLPLARGEVRPRLMPQATAAVFINTPEPRPLPDLRAVAQTYGLTPAEARVVERLLADATNLADVAADLDVTLNTVKTHLSQVFAKTGVSRQSDLIALMHRMTPAAR